MFSADASLVLRHLFENSAVVELLSLFQADVDV